MVSLHSRLELTFSNYYVGKYADDYGTMRPKPLEPRRIRCRRPNLPKPAGTDSVATTSTRIRRIIYPATQRTLYLLLTGPPDKDYEIEDPVLDSHPLASAPVPHLSEAQSAPAATNFWIRVWDEPSQAFCFFNRSTRAVQWTDPSTFEAPLNPFTPSVFADHPL